MINFLTKSAFATITSLFQKHKIEYSPTIIKPATIVHFDIRNYNLLSIMYQTEPEVLIKLMTNFIHRSVSFVLTFNGIFVNKHEQGTTASWNLPVEELNHIKKSINCALALVNKFHDINIELKQDKLPMVHAAIGISTGDITLVGKNPDYICSGESVNFSKFLSHKTLAYKVSIVVGKEIYDVIHNDFIIIELDKVYYDDNPITIYTIIGDTYYIPASHLAISYNHHNKFLRAYREQKWDIAISIANGLKNAWNNKLKDYYLVMIENCKHLKDNPPGEHWIELHK